MHTFTNISNYFGFVAEFLLSMKNVLPANLDVFLALIGLAVNEDDTLLACSQGIFFNPVPAYSDNIPHFGPENIQSGNMWTRDTRHLYLIS